MAERLSKDRHSSGRNRRVTSRQDHKNSISQEQPKSLSGIAMSEIRQPHMKMANEMECMHS